MRKGLERDIIFGFVIGIVILAVAIAVVVFFTQSSKERGERASCAAEEQAYCSQWCVFKDTSVDWDDYGGDTCGSAPDADRCNFILPGEPCPP